MRDPGTQEPSFHSKFTSAWTTSWALGFPLFTFILSQIQKDDKNEQFPLRSSIYIALYQTPILSPLGNVRLLPPQIQENVWACSKYFASLLKMKDKSLTLCYPGNFLLGPIVRWMCSPPVSQDRNKAQGQRNSIPRVLWTRSALPFPAETHETSSHFYGVTNNISK